MTSVVADRFRNLPWSLAMLWGTGLSMLSLGYRYTYCLDGAAWGTPFPILRPSHEGSTWTTILVGEIARVPSEIYLPGMAVNLLFWVAVAAVALALLRRRSRE